MRLSSLFVAAVLSVSPILFAQHSAGGSASSHSSGSSGSSSSGFSHSSYSGGSISSTSSHSSTSSTASTKSSSTKASAAPEEKSSSSLFHPFRKSKPIQSAEFKTPMPCLKGSCGFCPRGESRGASGACVLASNACPSGQAWNGFTCGTQGWFNDCGYLAQQLADQKRLMRDQNNYGQSLRYRMLQDQYRQCMMRSHSGFGAYAFNSMLLLNTP